MPTQMNDEEIIEKIRSMKWEKWLERPFHAFLASVFEDSLSKKTFEKIGIPGIDTRPQLYQDSHWYWNQLEMDKMDDQIASYLEDHDMKDILSLFEAYKKTSETTINRLIKSDQKIEERFAKIYDILSRGCAFIWLTHGLELYFEKKLKKEVPKYVKKNSDQFIGDASFPQKKNTNAILDDLLRSNTSSEEIAKRAGWIKVRDGFSDPFTVMEIEEMRRSLTPVAEVPIVSIPRKLQPLFEQVQDLVFFRTERTDVFHKFFFDSRPILHELADKYNIEFHELTYYRAKSFIKKRAEKMSPRCNFVSVNGQSVFTHEQIIKEESRGSQKISGAIAYGGTISGIVRVIKRPEQIDKMKKGEILVTQMTFPSFIVAMQKAAAFVTDEGGITCHAAIVAREMKKPCIIGTKIATQVLKDGDLVEVDADKGIVTILEE